MLLPPRFLPSEITVSHCCRGFGQGPNGIQNIYESPGPGCPALDYFDPPEIGELQKSKYILDFVEEVKIF